MISWMDACTVCTVCSTRSTPTTVWWCGGKGGRADLPSASMWHRQGGGVCAARGEDGPLRLRMHGERGTPTIGAAEGPEAGCSTANAGNTGEAHN